MVMQMTIVSRRKIIVGIKCFAEKAGKIRTEKCLLDLARRFQCDFAISGMVASEAVLQRVEELIRGVRNESIYCSFKNLGCKRRRKKS